MRLIHRSDGVSSVPHPAVPGQKALVEVPKKAAGIEAPGGTLGPAPKLRELVPIAANLAWWRGLLSGIGQIRPTSYAWADEQKQVGS